jgi:hypothetical protein
MRTIAIVVGFLTLWLLPPSVSAQAACADNETLKACWTRFSTGGTEERAAELADDRLHAKSTGLSALGGGFASAIGDFLPALAGNLGLTQTTTEEGATAFESNIRLPLGGSPQKVKLRALLRKPALYQPLADTLPIGTRTSRITELEKQLRDFDDVGVSVAWNLETGTFGRSFDQARRLYATYFERAVREVAAKSQTEAERLKAIMDFIGTFPDTESIVAPERADDPACADADNNPAKALVSCFRSDIRGRIAAAAAPAAELTGRFERELQLALADRGLYEFVDLVNNQPQFNVEAGVDVRRDLVGPNRFSVRARYETGFSNLNALRRFCRDRGVGPDQSECLTGYLASPGVRQSIKRGDRFFVSVEYGRRQDYRLELPTDGVALALPGTWDLTGSAGFGRYVAVNKAGEEVGRLDVQADYIHHQDDPDRQNRLVATGTYTQRLSDALSVAAGVSYASRPEFLGDVDKKVSANFGLRYKFVQK